MVTVSEALSIAIRHYQSGQFPVVEQICERILGADPNQPDALHLLGVIAARGGKHPFAAECIERAIRIRPDYAEAQNSLGLVLSAQGKVAAAAQWYRRALQHYPDFADAQSNLGNALRGLGRSAEAVVHHRRAVELNPGSAEGHNNLGVVLSDQGEIENAIASYRRALALKPDFAEAHNNLGLALYDLKEPEDVSACYRRALALKPNYAEAHNNLGVVLSDQGESEEAVACYRRALELKPNYAEGLNNMGLALYDQGKLDDAAACYRRAVDVKPDYAEAHLNQALLTLLTGDFERGWAGYEWRWKCKRTRPRNFSQPAWDGRPLAGRTILLHAEQGLGDTLQFIRYAGLVRGHGGRVVVECQPSLVSLLASCPSIDRLVAQGDSLPPFDVHAPLLSLPGILGTTLESIPVRVPYLRADPERVRSWGQEMATLEGLRVGVVWQGNHRFKGDRRRSVPVRHYEALGRVPGVSLVSVQKNPVPDQLRTLREACPVLDLGSRLETWDDTAAVLMNLDLLVSSCTSVPHLAGALEVPVRLALPFVPDWRWMREREDSPWYPNHRLFRQERAGDWGDVFTRIAAALRTFVPTRTTSA